MAGKPDLRTLLLVLIILFFLISSNVLAAPGEDEPIYQYARGEVIRVIDEIKETSEFSGSVTEKQLLEVAILDGTLQGETRVIENFMSGEMTHPAYNFRLKEGDKIVLALEVVGGSVTNVYMEDIVREGYVKILVFAFCILLIVMGGIKGLKALVALGLTVFAVLRIMLPNILLGHDPLMMAVLIGIGVSVITILIVGGFNGKSYAAIIGTAGGVFVAGLIAASVGTVASLSGLQEEAIMLMSIPQDINFSYRGLLFAGIVIGALGAMMDIGMSIASAVDEVKKANPTLGGRQLFRAGMNVGRDVMGTMTNTLVLAYTGSALPMLLLFMAYDTPLLKIINMDTIVSEIVRALAGSIGLILAIPITAACASLLPGPRSRLKSKTPTGNVGDKEESGDLWFWKSEK